MDIKYLHSTRFLFTKVVSIVLIYALAGCAGAPDEEWEEEVAVVESPAPEPVAEELEQASQPEPVELKANYPEKYVVVRGDTLWDIAASYLDDPWKWPRLWHFNPHIANPHLIYPGDILSIVFVNGQPVMQVTRDGQVYGPAADTTPAAETTREAGILPVEVPPTSQKYPTVKLSPRVREGDLEQAISMIPIGVIKPFLNRPRILAKGELEKAPYVVAHDDNRVMSAENQVLFVRGLVEEELSGNYHVVREGQAYRNPQDKGDILGYEAIHLGEVRLKHFADPSVVEVTGSKREIMKGDRLIPVDNSAISHNFYPAVPAEQVAGQIISVFDGVNMVGQHQIVVLNLGRQDDMDPGTVLAVKQRGNRVRDNITGDAVSLTPLRAGTVMIFRVFDRVSYALVMDATKTIRVNDIVTNP